MNGTVIIALAAVAIVFGPLSVVWALNTLFGLGIPYTIWTWLAAAVLYASLNASGSSKK